jgi:RimJ/RimL family protein N-acetyltransferase
MKVDIAPLSREDYEEIFALLKTAEPFEGFRYYDQFCFIMDSRTGFTHWVNGKLVGLISFSNYSPGLSVMIHAAFNSSYIEAMNRKVLRNAFDYAFNKLLVRRVDSYSIKGITDKIGKFLKRLGFKKEGCKKESTEINNKIYDVELYGMLRKDCKWI